MANPVVLLTNPFPKLRLFKDIFGLGNTRVPVPLPILTLAPHLLQRGYTPLFYDDRVNSRAELRRMLEENDVVCMGLSVLTGSAITLAMEIAAEVRRVNPDLPLVWGGPHASLMPEQTLKHPLVDYVIQGEGEESFADLVDALYRGRDVTRVSGVWWKANGQHRMNCPTSFDMDRSLVPPYQVLPGERYLVREDLHYESSRGCPFRCRFCDVVASHRKKWKMKSAEKVVNDLVEICAHVNPEQIQFVDDSCFVDTKRIEEICRGIIAHKLKLRWYTTSTARTFARLDDRFLQLLVDSGFFMIQFGAESASQRMLDLMDKAGITVEDIVRTVERAAEFGIETSCNFMAGLPGETRADVEANIAMIERLIRINPKAQVPGLIMYTPFPGTPFYELALEHGFKSPESLEEWGMFRLNRKEHLPWHDQEYLKSIEPLTLMSRWGFSRLSLRDDFVTPLRQLRLERVVLNCLRGIYALRRRHNFFAVPIDIRFGAWAREFLFGSG